MEVERAGGGIMVPLAWAIEFAQLVLEEETPAVVARVVHDRREL